MFKEMACICGMFQKFAEMNLHELYFNFLSKVAFKPTNSSCLEKWLINVLTLCLQNCKFVHDTSFDFNFHML